MSGLAVFASLLILVILGMLFWVDSLLVRLEDERRRTRAWQHECDLWRGRASGRTWPHDLPRKGVSDDRPAA